MLQRIQSVFLLLSAVFMSLTAFMPLAFCTIQTNLLTSFKMYSTGIIISQIGKTAQHTYNNIAFHTWGIIFWMTFSVIITLICIFLYKKRKIQIIFCYIVLLSIILFYATFIVYFHKIGLHINSLAIHNMKISLSYGLILPFISFIFTIISIVKIKKDEKLVRSLDRIR